MLKKLQTGDILDVVIWDRNFEETWIWPVAVPQKQYDPKVFFAENRHKLTYKGNMVWDICFPHGETIEHLVHLDTTSLDMGRFKK